MAPRSLYTVAAVAAIALAACSEREPGSTTGPEFAPGGNTDACGFSNSLVTNYFPSSRQAKILTLKQSMANAGSGTVNARTFGFEIMDSVGSVSRWSFSSPAAGAQLTVALIGCMFTNAGTFTYPEDDDNDPANDAISAFTKALNSAAGGAYYVRGGGTGILDVDGRDKTVLGTSHPLGGDAVNLSGIKPSSGSWTSMLAGNTASDGRVLLYGYRVPNTSALVYDWAGVPSGPTFSPAAVVAVCEEDNSSTAMIHEEDIGVLAYVETNICSETQSLTSAELGWGPRALAMRMGRMLAGALSPEPLQAAVVGKLVGGTTSTAPKSKFGKRTVSTLTLAWIDKPPPGINGTDSPTTPSTVPVSFTVSASGSPIAGTCAYLTGTNNNGVATKLRGKQDKVNCTNPPNGDTDALSVVVAPYSATASLADFEQVGVTKVGGIVFTGTADVLNRDGVGSISIKSNVKPRK
jgi:hypothetical protein